MMQVSPGTVDVFISRKSADRQLANQLYRFLSAKGLTVFESDETLPRLGNSDYRKAIDKALDECTHMVVVGSSAENISSSWVEAEWGFYISEKRAGRKKGNILTVTGDGLAIADLPASLRYYEVIRFEPENFERIAAYLDSSTVDSTGTPVSSKPEKIERKFNTPSVSESTRSYFRHKYSVDGCDYRIATGGALLFVEQIDTSLKETSSEYFLTHQRGSNLIKIYALKDGELVALLTTEHPLKNCRFFSGMIYAVHGSGEVISWRSVPSASNRWGIDWIRELIVEIPGSLENFKNPVIDTYIPHSYGNNYTITLLIRSEENISAGLVVEAKYNDKDNHYQPSLPGYYYDYVRGIKRLGPYSRKYDNTLVVLTKLVTEQAQIFWENQVIIKGMTNEDIVLDANDVVALHHDNRLLITRDESNAKAIRYIDPLISTEAIPIEYAHTFSTGFSNRGEIICYPHENLVAAKPSGDYRDIVIWARHHNKNKGGNFRKVLTGHQDKIDEIRWSESHYDARDPANSWWANFTHGWAGRSLISSSEDGTIRVWEPETGNELACFNNCHRYCHPFVWAVVHPPWSHLFLYADRDGFVHAFELIKKK